MPEPEVDASEHEASAEHSDAAQAVAEPKKSIFELPRREPARPDLPSDTVGPGGDPSKPT